MKWMTFSCIAILLTSSAFVHASERAVVCAKYAANYGWSEGYAIEATIASGSELNQATGSFTYDGLSTYVVIFWRQDQATIIKMSFPYLSAIGMDGEDQEGRKWQVAKTSVCI